MSRSKSGEKIANYSTSIDPERTISEIQRMLSASRRIESVTYEYKGRNGGVSAVLFVTDTSNGSRRYRLAPSIDQVESALFEQYESGLIPKRCATTEQAERVAWRLLADWLSLVLDYIRIGLFAFEDEMLSRMVVNDETGETAGDAFRMRALVATNPRPEYAYGAIALNSPRADRRRH